MALESCSPADHVAAAARSAPQGRVAGWPLRPLARPIRAALLLAAIFAAGGANARAGTNVGTVSGFVTDPTNVPLRGVSVAAVSPSARYSAKTDSRGFYVMTGVVPDTYLISFQLQAYESASVPGVTVSSDQQIAVSVRLSRALREIGKLTTRASSGSAFQPLQTTDTYTVTSQQIETIQGRSSNTSETNLLLALPGATLDSTGHPVLRGGRENEQGYQYEGIDYTDAFTSQFTNGLQIAGVGGLQLTPGAGDGSQGNSGTGIINLLTKRGTYPGFGKIELAVGGPAFYHQAQFEYGWATPDGRLSNYTTFTGANLGFQFGRPGVEARTIGQFFGAGSAVEQEFVDNLVFKFGRDNNQSLQVFADIAQHTRRYDYGGTAALNYRSGDPYFLAFAGAGLGLSTPQLQQIISFEPGQSSPQQPIARPGLTYYEPNQTLKLQYNWNIDSSTFLASKFYRVNAVATFDAPYGGPSPFDFSGTVDQGGQRTGFTIDATRQISEKHLLKAGAKFEYLKPTYNEPDSSFGFWNLTPFLGSGFDAVSFLNPANSGAAVCPLGTDGNGASYCGYLNQFFPNGTPRIPSYLEQTATNRQDLSAYLVDVWSPNSKLKVNLGGRIDAANYKLPGYDSGLYLPTGTDANGNPQYTYDKATRQPRVFEPNVGIAWQFRPNDSVRASYARSVLLAPLGDVDLYVPPGAYATFKNIPSYDAYGAALAGLPVGTANPAMWCGVSANQICANFAEQLRWANQNFFAGVPIQPVKPETFNNYEFSYSHNFTHGIALKITPFYRRGYDALALVATPKLGPGGQPVLDGEGNPLLNPAVATNLGVDRTTGVEFFLTKEAEYGLSGSLSATYLNETSNVIPTSDSEDFFPSIPPASLAAGNQYRVGFVSPFQVVAAFQYRWRSGLRINPSLSYVRGLPLGSGTLTAIQLNGQAVNVPNTNVTISSQLGGTTAATQYVDPANPGTLTSPNVAATRGTPERPSAGGFLSSGQVTGNLTLEFSPPKSKTTFGVQVFNVFNQIYGVPGLNPRWQPVATGVGGPLTGKTPFDPLYAGLGFANYNAQAFGFDPYLIGPNRQPTSYQAYLRVNL